MDKHNDLSSSKSINYTTKSKQDIQWCFSQLFRFFKYNLKRFDIKIAKVFKYQST